MAIGAPPSRVRHEAQIMPLPPVRLQSEEPRRIAFFDAKLPARLATVSPPDVKQRESVSSCNPNLVSAVQHIGAMHPV